jgi:hypothetical protein
MKSADVRYLRMRRLIHSKTRLFVLCKQTSLNFELVRIETTLTNKQ